MDIEQSSSDLSAVEPKMLTQEEVNVIVGREKAAAAEKARRQALAEMQSQSVPQAIDEEAIYRRLQEKANKDAEERLKREEDERNQAAWQELVGEYNSKLAAAKNSESDFDEVMRDFNHSAYNAVIAGATREVPNTAEVMYELAKSPSKAASLDNLAYRDYKAFTKELKKLSESITKNKEAAKNTSKAPEPLSQIKPSVMGADNGQASYQDLRKKFRN